MLDTLRRTIDEIYSACETDESEVECKEVIMILEHSKQDFHSLIEKMNLLRDYEQADDRHKPNSLAWDERTTLPGKPIMCQLMAMAAAAAAAVNTASLSSRRQLLHEISDQDGQSSELGDSWQLLVHPSGSQVDSITTTDAAGAACTRRPFHTGTTPPHSSATHQISSPRSVSDVTYSGFSASITGDNDEEDGEEEDDETEEEDEVEDDPLETPLDADMETDAVEDVEADDEDDEDLLMLTKKLAEEEEEEEEQQQEDETGSPVGSSPRGEATDASLSQVDTEVHTLSRDLQQLNEAIATVTSAERVLTDELGRAQYAEAALRRRLFSEVDPNEVGRKLQQQQSSSTTTERWRAQRTSMVDSSSTRRQKPTTRQIPELPLQTDVDTQFTKMKRQQQPHKPKETIQQSTCTSRVGKKAKHTCCECHCHATTTSNSGAALTLTLDPRTSCDFNAPKLTAAPEQLPLDDYPHRNVTRGSATTRSLEKAENLLNLAGDNGDMNEGLDDEDDDAETQWHTVTNTPGDVGSDNPRQLDSPVPSTTSAGLSPRTDDTSILLSPYPSDVFDSIASPHHLTPRKTGTAAAAATRPTRLVGRPLTGTTNRSIVAAVSSAGAATASTNSLVFLSDLSAKSRVPGHGIQMHEKLSARSQRWPEKLMLLNLEINPRDLWNIRRSFFNSAGKITGLGSTVERSSCVYLEPYPTQYKLDVVDDYMQLEQKQARARTLRQRHLLERAERVHELSKKVEEVHIQKRLLLHQRRSCLERRLHAAERKRKAELQRRVLKAHDEETKGREIAFIQTLEAEQKQHSILTKHEESRVRLDEIAAERRRRLDEKLCREEAAKGRRRELEDSRRARLDALQARWETRAQRLASRAEHLEHTRRAAARAKEQHREVKMASLEAQQRTHIEQLRTRIQRKQAESERRHQESLREISRKAFEMSVLTHTGDESTAVAGMEPYPIQKWCRACQEMIVSEVALKSHLHGKRHQRAVLEAGANQPLNRSDLEAFNLLHLVDAPADVLDSKQDQAELDRLRLRRKRARKLRQRMNQRASQYLQESEISKAALPDSPNRAQLQKLIKDARRFLNLPESGPWVATRVQAMEKTLNALLRCLGGSGRSVPLEKPLFAVDSWDSFSGLSRVPPHEVDPTDRIICIALGLLPVLVNLIGLVRIQRPYSTQLVPERTYQLAAEVLITICRSATNACQRMMCSNDISALIDSLIARFSIPCSTNRSRDGATTKDDGTTDADSVHFSVVNPCTLAVLNCVTCVMSQLVCDASPRHKNSGPADVQRIQDLLSYVVSSGLVDLLATRLSSPRQANCLLRPHGNNPRRSASNVEPSQRLVLSSIALLTNMIRLLGYLPSSDACKQQRPAVVESNGFSPGVVASSQLNIGEESQARFRPSRLGVPGIPDDDRCPSVSSRDTPLDGCASVSSSRPPTELRPASNDPTRLVETILHTEVFGLIPLLYCLLLDPSTRPAQTATPTMDTGSRRSGTDTDTASVKRKQRHAMTESKLPNESLPFHSQAVGQIALQCLRLINSFAVVNRPALQSILSSELTSLLTRHILLTLLTRCVPSRATSTSACAPPLTVCAPASLQQPAAVESLMLLNDGSDSGAGDGRDLSMTPVLTSKRRQSRLPTTVDEERLIPSGARQVIVARSAGLPKHAIGREDCKPKSTLCSSLATGGLPDWAIEDGTSVAAAASGDQSAPVGHVIDEASSVVESVLSGHSKIKTGEPLQQSLSSPLTGIRLTEAVLHECILCVGHLCALNRDNQTALQSGPAPTLLQCLVALPFDYFSQLPLTDILYPSLIACCYLHPTNVGVLEAELNPMLLANYIEERLLERTMKSLSNGAYAQVSSNDGRLDSRFRFELRFPIDEWEAAKVYFTRSS